MVPYGDDSILSCNMLMVASCGVYFSFTEDIIKLDSDLGINGFYD